MPAGVSDRTRDTHSGKKRVQERQRKVWREKATAFCPWHRVSLFPTHKREPKRSLSPEPVASRWRPPLVRGTPRRRRHLLRARRPLPSGPEFISSHYSCETRVPVQFPPANQSLSFLSCFEKDEGKEEKAGQQLTRRAF